MKYYPHLLQPKSIQPNIHLTETSQLYHNNRKSITHPSETLTYGIPTHTKRILPIDSLVIRFGSDLGAELGECIGFCLAENEFVRVVPRTRHAHPNKQSITRLFHFCFWTVNMN